MDMPLATVSAPAPRRTGEHGAPGFQPRRHNKRTRRRVRIGGKRVPLVVAALMGQEADRLHVAPSIVGRVSVPNPPPTHVEIARNRLTVRAAACIASVADRQGVEPATVIADILEKHIPQMATEDDAKDAAENGARV